MAPPTLTAASTETLADRLERLGSVPLHRIPMSPAPGTATEADVLARLAGEKRLCELVDGVLVEKVMGYYESLLASRLIGSLQRYLEEHDLGFVLGEAGTLRLVPGLVRMPDVSFITWDRVPDRELPAEPIPDLVPDLAVEVLSEGNTPAEIDRKVAEYFAAGTRLVWIADPRSITVRVYSAPDRSMLLTEEVTLEGGDVLPGFSLGVGQWLRGPARRRR